MNRLGHFEWGRPPTEWPTGRPFETVRDWNLWQIAHYRDELERLRSVPSAHPAAHLFWEDAGVVHLSRGNRDKRLQDIGIGSARFFGDRIEFESETDRIVMPVTEISSFSVFKQHFTEFYHDHQLYRFSFTDRSVSGYKWLMLFHLMTR